MSQPQEFVVRVPQETDKKYHVMRFHNALNVDVTKWKNVKLERENNNREVKLENDEELPKFGAGSEFGREQKEEARKKKYGRYGKKYNPDDQPWQLRVGGKAGKRFRGIREGGVNENTSYYVFFQASDGAFEAIPVSEWYNFAPVLRYKALTAEEAEEQFEKRDKILNFFSVMSKKKKDADGGETSFAEEKPKKGKGKAGFKVSDMDEWGLDSDAEREESDEEEEKPKGKGKAKKAIKKKKKKGSDDEEESALEESDEGDFDEREVDYMSNTSSEEDEPEEERISKGDAKGVGDEDALRQLILTDDEDEENPDGEEKKDDNKPVEEVAKSESDPAVKKEKPEEFSESSAEDSEDSDFDDTKFHSAMFMQKKKEARQNKKDASEANSAAGSRADTPLNESVVDGKEAGASTSKASKRKLEHPSPSGPSKKAKPNGSLSSEGISEEAIRRYLVRKPMTTKELLKKFKNKTTLDSSQLIHTIVQILKKLNPDKQKIKDELYLSLKA